MDYLSTQDCRAYSLLSSRSYTHPTALIRLEHIILEAKRLITKDPKLLFFNQAKEALRQAYIKTLLKAFSLGGIVYWSNIREDCLLLDLGNYYRCTGKRDCFLTVGEKVLPLLEPLGERYCASNWLKILEVGIDEERLLKDVEHLPLSPFSILDIIAGLH